MRKFVVHSISTWAYPCVKRYETVIHELVERKRKRKEEGSVVLASVNRARFVKWKGVAFSGKDRTGSPRDLTSLDPQFPTALSCDLETRFRFAQRALLGTIYSLQQIFVLFKLFTRKSKITRVTSIVFPDR